MKRASVCSILLHALVLSPTCQNSLDLWVPYVSRSSGWDDHEQAAIEILSGLLVLRFAFSHYHFDHAQAG